MNYDVNFTELSYKTLAALTRYMESFLGQEEAIRLGADAVSVHVNIGGKEESEMLVKLGNVADQCDEWQIPFIAMMYPRGENIKNPRDGQIAAHVARIGS